MIICIIFLYTCDIKRIFYFFFKDFFIRGEMAIGSLIAHSRYMGSNIGFLFTDDEKKFRKGLQKFVLNENDERFKGLNAFMKHNRAIWYESFNDLRNKIEHEGWHLPNLQYTLDLNNKVQVRLPTSPNQTIEEILESYWQSMSAFCEEVIVFLLSLKLRQDMIIVFIPEEKRDKLRVPESEKKVGDANINRDKRSGKDDVLRNSKK